MWLSSAVPEWKHQSYFHPLFLELVTESTSSPLEKKKKKTKTNKQKKTRKQAILFLKD